MSLAMLNSRGEPGMLSLLVTMWTLFLGSLCVMLAIIAYKKYHTEKMETAIAALPPESLPTILPHIQERQTLFREATEPVYDVWTCKNCGTDNKSHTAQCKKCGKFRGA